MLRSIFLIGFLSITINGASADTLETVQARGVLKCGVSQGLAGFSSPDDQGQWSGIDVDYCRAIAAAVLGDPVKVQFIPLSAKERFTALQSTEIDILARNTTWTFLRDTTLGINFVGVLFYDGQEFMVPKKFNIQALNDLNGATICTNAGTTTELNIADVFAANNIAHNIVTFEKTDETVAAFEAGRCDAYSTDGSALVAQRLRLRHPEQYEILPFKISKEPLAPAVRQGDDRWLDITRWVLFTLINAEEYNVRSDNIESMQKQLNPNIQRMLDHDNTLGEKLGLAPGWSGNIISKVGNYGEIFAHNLGAQSIIKLPRGINALYQDGGIVYAPPIR